MKNKIDVLDHGYIILHDVMGDDLAPVNAARVSYDKRSEEYSDKDDRLLRFLAREGHTSPFRHATLQFEVYAPLMVARQWWKYVVGSDHVMDAWNESSRRYITEEPVFYVPKRDEWRSAPSDSKQGSGEVIEDAEGFWMYMQLMEYIEEGERLYSDALDAGVCAEQARLFLPAYGMYVRWYWTASLESVAHFLGQRLEHDAQKEIQLYAQAVDQLARQQFPNAIDYLLEYK